MLPTVIIARNAVDPILASVVVARESRNLFDLRFYEDDELPEFFSRSLQHGLPARYELVVLGLNPRRRTLAGELIRPKLMDALRTFGRPIRWLSTEAWDAEDAGAVRHIVGDKNLLVAPSAGSCLELAASAFGADDAQARKLVRVLKDGAGAAEWAEDWLRVLGALRLRPARLLEAVELLIKGEPELLGEDLLREAQTIAAENARLLETGMKRVTMDGMRMAWCVAPADRRVFRAELGAEARTRGEAAVSLIGFPEAGIAILASEPELARRLAEFAKYPVEALSGFDLERDTRTSWSIILPKGLNFPSAFSALLSALGEGVWLLRG